MDWMLANFANEDFRWYSTTCTLAFVRIFSSRLPQRLYLQSCRLQRCSKFSLRSISRAFWTRGVTVDEVYPSALVFVTPSPMRDCGFLKCKSSIAQSVIYIFLSPLRLSLLHLLMPQLLPCDLILNLHLNHWLKLHAPSAVLENRIPAEYAPVSHPFPVLLHVPCISEKRPFQFSCCPPRGLAFLRRSRGGRAHPAGPARRATPTAAALQIL